MESKTGKIQLGTTKKQANSSTNYLMYIIDKRNLPNGNDQGISSVSNLSKFSMYQRKNNYKGTIKNNITYSITDFIVGA